MHSYAEYLYALGMSESTVRNYRRCLERFIAWCHDEGADPVGVTALELAMYAQTIPLTATSRRQHRVALRHWYESMGRVDAPLAAIRVPPKRRYMSRALEPGEAAQIAATATQWHPEGTAVLFGLYLGLRRTEIAKARWDRFDPDLSGYTVVGKGDVSAWLPVHPVLQEALTGRMGPYPWLFPGRRAAHVSAGTINDWVARVGSAAGVANLEPHRLRHTAITTVYEATGDIRVAQTFARHALMETTQIYTRVTRDRLLRAVDALAFLPALGVA